jgi:hypothetical protein
MQGKKGFYVGTEGGERDELLDSQGLAVEWIGILLM